MASSEKTGSSKGGRGEGTGERAARILRNINVVGAVALAGAAVFAPPLAAAGLNTWAGINAVQAGGFEAARRWAKKRRAKNG